MHSCEKINDSEHLLVVNKYEHYKSKDQLKVEFGIALAKVLEENKDVRNIIKEEAQRKIDYDYDILYLTIKNRMIQNNQTVEKLLLKYIPKDSLTIITTLLPTLTIFIPELPENTFSAETWNTSNTIPKVAIRLSSSNEVPVFDYLGNKRTLLPDEIPAFPVVVIKENERIIADNFSDTRLISNNVLNKVGLKFIDPVFNNSAIKEDTSLKFLTSRVQPKLDSRFNIMKEAYKQYPTGSNGWQRDYVYYGISPSIHEGQFKYSYKEYIWGFEMIGNAASAINKISDQTGDPTFNGNMSGNRVIGTGWTDGEFEFLVKAYVGSKTGVGNEFKTAFRIKGSDLFKVAGTREGDVIKISSVYNTRVLFTEPIPLFAWNLNDYSSTIKIAIEEVDATETITQSISTTSEFATNFKVDLNTGDITKIGAEFGTSSKNSTTVTYQTSTTKGNDELGEVIINFGDPILKDTTAMYPYTSGRGTPPYYFLNMSPQYYTGWYRLFVAPGPAN